MSKKIGPLAKLHGWDKFTVIAMSIIPLVIVGVFVWIPALCTVILSFSNWDGIGGLGDIHFVGIQNYIDMFTIYPPFWPACGTTSCGFSCCSSSSPRSGCSSRSSSIKN